MRTPRTLTIALCLLAAVVAFPAQAQTKSRQELIELRADRQQRIQAQREAMNARLQTITDERKAKRAEQLADQMNQLNERLTDHYLSVLDHLDAVLTRIAERAVDEVSDADLQAKITTARTNIVSVRQAVIVQQDKVYTVNITTEAKMREAFQGVKKQMQDDHAAARELLSQARESVRQAFADLKEVAQPEEESADTNS